MPEDYFSPIYLASEAEIWTNHGRRNHYSKGNSKGNDSGPMIGPNFNLTGCYLAKQLDDQSDMAAIFFCFFAV